MNILGEPHDDIKQALYSSWCEFEEALCMIGQRRADMKYGYATETTEREFLDLLSNKLTHARNMIEEFAPNYHNATLEDWAQAAAEANHP